MVRCRLGGGLLLGHHEIDPIQYDLLFERFLNPDRISLPDIDVDFDDDGRGEVLRWVTEKYGQEKVAHIITYGTMATKMAIKDVARVQKLPLSESDRLCKLVPDKIPEQETQPAQCHCLRARIAGCGLARSLVRDTMKYAKMLEGNVRGTGVHAAVLLFAVTTSRIGYPSARRMIRRRARRCSLPNTKVPSSKIRDLSRWTSSD